ncbi:MAG: LysM peptidoglycan-binding domain-containing protein [Chloroflexi bacterium]|nr:LysM peptidoglycan-binding domain-containing protein [Chloroflexota bacterium]
MKNSLQVKRRAWRAALLFLLFSASCNLRALTPPPPIAASSVGLPAPYETPLPVRRAYKPGELVDYTAQTGDTLPALAARFNTTVEEILEANPFIPRDATTMPPGMPMKIPIYFLALWASPFQILPDHAFVNGPPLIGFNTAAYLQSQPGWLKSYRVYAGGQWRSGGEMVDYVALNYSVSPRLLLAILEYQGGALTQPAPPVKKNLLGFTRKYWENPYLQLVIAANTLNNGYYGWRSGNLTEFERVDGSLIRPDPWQNAASVALQYYFSQIFAAEDYDRAVGPEGLIRVYKDFFGDPWKDSIVLIPGSLRQPEFQLPFPLDQTWYYTGGPHTGWGTGEPLAAVDFAPPSDVSGCFVADEKNYATAMADGLVVRSTVEGVALDLDKDGDERTGWVVFYLHLASRQRAPLGAELKAGDLIGYPSCEGGRATGSHVHVARKYNGEWIDADGAIPLVMSGWLVHDGKREYLGTLTKSGSVVTASETGDSFTAINGLYP